MALRGLRKAARKGWISKKRASLPRVKRMAIMGTGLPQKVMVKHRYANTLLQLSTPGQFQGFAVSANGMYIPDVGAAGQHQPMYFDQYAALYNHYTVIGSKITFKVTNYDDGATHAYRMCSFVDDNNTLSATNIDAIAESTQGRTVKLIPAGDQGASYTQTLKWSAKRTFGGSTLANDSLKGTASSNPTEQSYFVLCLQALPSQLYNVVIHYEVEYVAIWRELKEVAQS